MRETALHFERNGRTYDCGVENLAARGADGRGATAKVSGAWWWFAVSGDGQRYAPFRAEPGDAAATVEDRIVSYYEGLVAHRATPTVRSHWGRRPNVAPAPGTGSPPLPPAADAAEVAEPAISEPGA